MSKADVERFVNDLKSNTELLAEVKGGASGIASVVEIAKAHGYDISVAEARDYIQSQTSSQLTDAQLDAVAGGKGHHSVSTVTEAVSVQTAATVTTEATGAETTAEVAAEAVAVVVLT